MAILAVTLPQKVKALPVEVRLAGVALLLLGMWGLRNLLLPHALTCLGLVMLPLLARLSPKAKSIRYLLPALVLTAFAYFTKSMTLAYFAWVFTFFLMTESLAGRLNYLPLFASMVISPIFGYVLNVFSFSLRLQLTSLAGKLLSLIGPTSVEGNLIYFNDHLASVDPACMGLNLTETALLLGIVCMARYEKLHKKSFTFMAVVSMLGGVFALNLLANLVRIVLLVLFKILPGTLMHDVTGIACLLVYVAVPAFFLIRWAAQGNYWIKLSALSHKTYLPAPSLLTAALTCLLLLHIGFYKSPVATAAPQFIVATGGYNMELLEHETIKLHNSTSLVYLKKILYFYRTEHNPMNCWTGSGYEMKQVKELNLNGHQVYEGLLVNKQDSLYTAWWYSNGQHQTISQWDWRWRVMRGEDKFYLVNVTAESPALLQKEVERLWKITGKRNSFKPQYHKTITD
jgi:exosortase N